MWQDVLPPSPSFPNLRFLQRLQASIFLICLGFGCNTSPSLGFHFSSARKPPVEVLKLFFLWIKEKATAHLIFQYVMLLSSQTISSTVSPKTVCSTNVATYISVFLFSSPAIACSFYSSVWQPAPQQVTRWHSLQGFSSQNQFTRLGQREGWLHLLHNSPD